MKKLFTGIFILSFLFCSNFTNAQVATIVKDLTPGTDHSFTDSDDKIVAEVNGLALFVIRDDNNISWLYSTDGTDAGTTLLQTGATTSIYFRDFVQAGSVVAYVHYNQALAEYELYTTNGATITLLDKHNSSNSITNLHFFNDTLYYNDADELRKIDLLNAADALVLQASDYFNDYYFDGQNTLYYAVTSSADDTLFVRNMLTATDTKLGGIGEAIYKGLFFNKVNNKIVLFNEENNSTISFYSTDGTPGGTTFLKRFYSGYESNFYLVLNNKIYFSAMLALNDPNLRGLEVWASDGTPGGTISLYSNATQFDYTKSAVIYNGEVYFVAQESFVTYLYKTDGTQSGTSKVLASTLRPYWDPNTIAVIGTDLYIAAERASPNNVGVEIWKTDGTSGGTTLYQTISGSATLFYEHLYATSANLFFVGDKNTTGRELYLVSTSITPIIDETEKKSFNCYPNPFSQQLNIDYKGNEEITSVRILNTNGAIVKEFENHSELNTETLLPGFYILEIETSKGPEYLKIQKR